MEKVAWQTRALKWLAGNVAWELFRGPIAIGFAAVGSLGIARLVNARPFNIFLAVVGVIGICWAVGLFPLRKRNGQARYSIADILAKIFIVPTGFGPQLYVDPRHPLAIRNIELTVVNFLPFAIELENLQVSTYLDETPLLMIDQNINHEIAAASLGKALFDRDLSDNQARLAREYPHSHPFFKMHGTVKFRTPQGLQPVGISTAIRCDIKKEIR